MITAPFLFEELFALFGKRLDDYARLVPVEPWYRFVFPNGRGNASAKSTTIAEPIDQPTTWARSMPRWSRSAARSSWSA